MYFLIEGFFSISTSIEEVWLIFRFHIKILQIQEVNLLS